jgi:transcriptional regulator with XRE-family HTH domain
VNGVPEHVWSDQEVRSAVAMRNFGNACRLIRERGGLRQADIAGMTGLSQSFLSMLESGHRRLNNLDKIVQFLNGLSAPSDLYPAAASDSAASATGRRTVGFVARSPDPELPWTAARMVKALEVAMEPNGDASGIGRRGLLAASGIALTAFVNRWGTAQAEPLQRPVAGSQLTSGLLDSLQHTTDHLRTIDAAGGSGTLWEHGDRQLAFLHHLTKRSTYNEETGRRLAAVIADTAAQTGWFAFDAGDRRRPLGYLYAALRAAKASGDARLGAAALSYIAIYSYSTGMPHQAVAAAEQARRKTEHLATPALQAMLLTRQARGHAKLGERQRATAALEQALELCAQGPAENDPHWLYWISEAEVRGQAGSCYLDLGDLDRAVGSFARAREALDPEQQRTMGLFLSRAATAHFARGDADAGSVTAHQALDISERVQSTRLDEHVRDMLRQLPRDTNNQQITDVRERAAAMSEIGSLT